jgi:thiamine-monophosphate kinase
MPKKNLPPEAPGVGEFALIARHFSRPGVGLPTPVVLGVGDDCALLQPTPGHQLAISCDMLVEGRHFFPHTNPASLGHKALAVNLSDLAAMGARPLGFTLALALPALDDAWLADFARGLFALTDRHACPLVGGDTTRGPLNICITVFGELLPGRALRRDAAQPGDDLWLSGRTGEARLALAHRQGLPWATAQPAASLIEPDARLDRPTPRLALGSALAGVAHAATSCAPAPWAPRSTGPRCQWRPRWPRCRWRSSKNASCTVATTTSCWSPPHPPPASRCRPPHSAAAHRCSASAACWPRQACT